MSKVEFKLNRQGVRELLQSEGAMNVCRGFASEIQGRCGDGYEVTTYTGKTRVNASVITASQQARRENLENNTLLKAVRG